MCSCVFVCGGGWGGRAHGQLVHRTVGVLQCAAKAGGSTKHRLRLPHQTPGTSSILEMLQFQILTIMSPFYPPYFVIILEGHVVFI